jgi:putative ABC transport system permease protein
MAQDLLFALRTLRKSPGYAFIAIAVLAAGIGANSAIFSVVHSVLLRPLPYPNSNEVVEVVRKFDGGDIGEVLSANEFIALRDKSKAFDSVGAIDYVGAGFNLTGIGTPERIRGARASWDLFRTLRVQPALGRTFTKQEDTPTGEPVAIISSGLWKRRFGGEPGILNQSLEISGKKHSIVGVMPDGFQVGPAADVWVPLRAQFSELDRAHLLLTLARRGKGMSAAQVDFDVRRVYSNMQAQNPDIAPKGLTFFAPLYLDMLTGSSRTALWILTAAVGLVLLIACANVANLMLARATGRQKEIAIRTAMGATRWRIVRQLLTESVLLASVGGVFGVILANIGLRLLLNLTPDTLPRAGEITVDSTVLIFTMLLAIGSGTLFGLAPAFGVSNTDLHDTLKESSGRSSAGGNTGRLRNALVICEVALSLMLLIGAGLLIQSFLKLRAASSGFDPHNVLTMKMSTPVYKQTAPLWDFADRLLQRIGTTPGVFAAGASISLPMQSGTDMPFARIDRKDAPQNTNSQWRYVTPRYFDAVGMKVARGRDIGSQDTGSAPLVAVINETFARIVFPDLDPIGQQIQVTQANAGLFAEAPRQIIGIVKDVHENGPSRGVPGTVYVPLAQVQNAVTAVMTAVLPVNLAIRTAGEPLRMTETIQQQILTVDANQPIADVRSMEQVIAATTAQERFQMTLLAVFAAVALILAAVGIYGVVSYGVAQRTREIGVRMALGASNREVVLMVLRQSFGVVSIGLVTGLAGAFAVSRFLSSLLFGVQATDPWIYLSVAVLLALVGLAASGVPALRASRIDPITAIRTE